MDQTVEQAENALILNTTQVQMAQVQFEACKVDLENMMTTHQLHLFMKVSQEILKEAEALKAENKTNQTIQTVIKVCEVIAFVIVDLVVLASIICSAGATAAFGVPLLIAMVAFQVASLVPSGEKDKNGNSLSCIDYAVKQIAIGVGAGDNPNAELAIRFLFALGVIVLTLGVGVGFGLGMAVEGMGSAFLSALPQVVVMAIGGAGCPTAVAQSLEKNKEFMKWFGSVVNGSIIPLLNSLFDSHIKPLNEKGLDAALEITINIAFCIAALVGSLAPVAISKLASAATATAETAEAAEAVGAGAADAAIEMQVIAPAAAEGVAGAGVAGEAEAGAQGAAGVQAAEEGAQAAEQALAPSRFALSAVKSQLLNMKAWVYGNSIKIISALLFAAGICKLVEAGADAKLALSYYQQAQRVMRQKDLGVLKNTIVFDMKLLMDLVSNDTQAAAEKWKAYQELNECFAHFADAQKAIADVMV